MPRHENNGFSNEQTMTTRAHFRFGSLTYIAEYCKTCKGRKGGLSPFCVLAVTIIQNALDGYLISTMGI